jgi:tetratricopeptide (TPR) repeat protein
VSSFEQPIVWPPQLAGMPVKPCIQYPDGNPLHRLHKQENTMTTNPLIALENEAEQLKVDGKYDEAIAKLEEALSIDENFVRAYLGLSVLYHKKEQYEKSVELAEKAVALEPEDTFN